MADVLIISRSNAYGLTQDADILADAIAPTGLRCTMVAHRRDGFSWFRHRPKARIAFHLERAFPTWFAAAALNYLIPNQERFPRRMLGRLRRVDRVLAKTRHAEAVFADLGFPTSYIGFASRDRRITGISRDRQKVLHLAGGSTLKGTEDVLAVWARHPEWPQLVLVQKAENAPSLVPPNVELRAGYLGDAELRRLQNACAIHLCPSRAEGWGHHIVEAMSCGALVVTTDAPPMNEHVTAETGLLVPVAHTGARHLGSSFHVDPDGLEREIARAMSMPAETFEERSRAARAAYDAMLPGLRSRIAAHIAPALAAPD